MHILKLKLNFNSTKLKKNSSESKIHKFKLVKPRNFFEKINKYRSEEKMKKIKSKDPYNMNGELTKNIMESITIEKLGQTLNASFLNIKELRQQLYQILIFFIGKECHPI